MSEIVDSTTPRRASSEARRLAFAASFARRILPQRSISQSADTFTSQYSTVGRLALRDLAGRPELSARCRCRPRRSWGRNPISSRRSGP